MSEAQERLELCQAETALIVLCRECLSPEREKRPRNADVVVKRVNEHLEELEERLQKAERERVAAETRAIVEQERAQEVLARAEAEIERAQKAQALAKEEEDPKRKILARRAAIAQREREARWMERTKKARRTQQRRWTLAAIVFFAGIGAFLFFFGTEGFTKTFNWEGIIAFLFLNFLLFGFLAFTLAIFYLVPTIISLSLAIIFRTLSRICLSNTLAKRVAKQDQAVDAR